MNKEISQVIANVLSDKELVAVVGGGWAYSTEQARMTIAGGRQSGYQVFYTTGKK